MSLHWYKILEKWDNYLLIYIYLSNYLYLNNISRYKMLKHGAEKANPERFKYLYSGAKRISKDGYNSLKYRYSNF